MWKKINLKEIFIMKESGLGSFLLGFVLTCVGVIAFLKNTVIYQGGFGGLFMIGGRNYAGLLILLMIIAFVALIVRPNFITKLICIGIVLLFLITIILNLDFHFRTISAFDAIIMFGTLGAGIAFLLKALVFNKTEDSSDAYKEYKTKKKELENKYKD